LAVVLVASPALAVEPEDLRFDTTEDLYQVCSSDPSSPAQLACTGFIEATVQYHDGVANKRDMKRLICYPAETTIANGRTAFVAWAESNKDDAKLMGEQPVVGLVRALADAYPCR
jgi:hypothetical protein